MFYLSTRGHPGRKHFCEILLEGLAPDGGLYLPEQYPQVTPEQLSMWRGLPYADLAFEVLSLYIDDIPADDLRAICRKTYTEEVFGTKEIVPHRQLEEGVYLQALSNGPTLAFKDIAMDDAVRGTLELMEAPAKAITERGSYNLAGVSFTPREIADEIRKHLPDFEMGYEPDFRQAIASGWPDSIDDSCARRDWGWAPRYDLAATVRDMLENLSGRVKPRSTVVA